MNRINKKSGLTLIELVVVVCIIVVMFGIVAGNLFVTAEGKRVGVLTKFSYKGIFIKSYEGELNMGGVRNHIDNEGRSSMVANSWQFSCSDARIAKQLEDLLGKEVVIKYHQSFPGLSRSTAYDVVSVEEVKIDRGK